MKPKTVAFWALGLRVGEDLFGESPCNRIFAGRGSAQLNSGRVSSAPFSLARAKSRDMQRLAVGKLTGWGILLMVKILDDLIHKYYNTEIPRVLVHLGI